MGKKLMRMREEVGSPRVLTEVIYLGNWLRQGYYAPSPVLPITVSKIPSGTLRRPDFFFCSSAPHSERENAINCQDRLGASARYLFLRLMNFLNNLVRSEHLKPHKSLEPGL